MKAAVYHEYGPPEVVTISDVPTPTPGHDQVLVRIHAATVGAADSAARAGSPAFARLAFGLRRPKFPVLGSEFAGVVEAVGTAVTKFQVGDQVYGVTGADFGAHAEYVCVSEQAAMVAKPANLSFAEAVAIVDGTAMCFLRDKAKLRSGQSILINGASGAVGSAAVQVAKHLGATVTGVCSGSNLELVRKLGADVVIDYTAEDFTRAGVRYDVIFDAAGKSSFSRCRSSLQPGGVYLTTVPSLGIMFAMPWTSMVGNQRAVIAFTGLRRAKEKLRDLVYTRELAESGAIVPVIQAVLPLEQIADAYRAVDGGHKRGNVVVTMT